MGDYYIILSFKVPFSEKRVKIDTIKKELMKEISAEELEYFSVSYAYWGRGIPNKKYLEYAISTDRPVHLEKEEIKHKIQLMPILGKIMYTEIKPLFGYGDWWPCLEHWAWDFKECVFWLNFFDPELVKKIGKQKLLSAPAYKIEELKDGGIFIQASEYPNSDANDQLAKHLGFKGDSP